MEQKKHDYDIGIGTGTQYITKNQCLMKKILYEKIYIVAYHLRFEIYMKFTKLLYGPLSVKEICYLLVNFLKLTMIN